MIIIKNNTSAIKTCKILLYQLLIMKRFNLNTAFLTWKYLTERIEKKKLKDTHYTYNKMFVIFFHKCTVHNYIDPFVNSHNS